MLSRGLHGGVLSSISILLSLIKDKLLVDAQAGDTEA